MKQQDEQNALTSSQPFWQKQKRLFHYPYFLLLVLPARPLLSVIADDAVN